MQKRSKIFRIGVCLIAGIVILFSLCPDVSAGTEEEEADSFTIYFFHETACASCDGTEDFIEIFNEQVGDIKEDYHYELVTANTFKESGQEKLESVLSSIGLTTDDVSLPLMVIGDSAISSLDNIEAELRDLFIQYGEGYQASYVEVAEDEEAEIDEDAFADYEVDPESSYISFFYTLSCDDCASVEEFLETLPESVTIDGTESEVVIESFSIAEADGLEKVRLMFDAYEVPEEDQMVPIIFYAGGYWAGAEEIEDELLEALEAGELMGFSYPSGSADIEPITLSDLPGLALTGLLNGFNPCSISILFLLLSLIMMEKKKILKIGFTFIAGKFVTYFVLGFALYSVISVIDFGIFDILSNILNVILIAAALFLAILNLMDFFALRRNEYGKVRAQLPAPLRRFNNNMVKRVLKDSNRRFLLPLIFLAAIIISAGEFLCTGQIYLGTIIYMLKRGTGNQMMTVLAFLIYITMMCVPQSVMIILVRCGANVMSLTDATRRKFPVIKLVYFALFLAFAVALFVISFL